MSRKAAGAALAPLVGLGLLGAAACGGSTREPFVTYFNGDLGVSLRHPSSWKADDAQQDGVFYRYFLAPPAGPKHKPVVSATLLVGELSGSLDEYAQKRYLAGNTLLSTRDEARGSAKGRSYLFASPDGSTRQCLLLLAEAGRVYGLYAQGEAPLFEKHYPALEEMARSLTLERAADYPERRNARFGFALRVPASWKETRAFSGSGTLLLQFRSPALAADRDREPVHASLTLTVEPVEGGGDVDVYYEATREKLGDAFQILGHAKWRGGYADVMRTETPVAVSRVKRFYRAADGRGYSLAFEAREDVFPRVTRWCDMIAGTLRVGEELQQQ